MTFREWWDEYGGPEFHGDAFESAEAAWNAALKEKTIVSQDHVPRSDRRMKRLPVGEQQLLALLVGLGDRMPLAVRVAKWNDLPTGCRVVGVHHDIYCRTFFFVLEHPSFEVVPDGMMIPQLDCEVTAVELDDVRAFPPTYTRFEEFGPDGSHRIVYEEKSHGVPVEAIRYNWNGNKVYLLKPGADAPTGWEIVMTDMGRGYIVPPENPGDQPVHVRVVE